MKKVAPNARSFDSDMPLTIAAIECSRLPRGKFLPPGWGAPDSPAPLVLRRVLVRRAEIRRAAEEPGDVLREDVEHLARGVPSGYALRIRREDRQVAVPTGRELAPLHLVYFRRELGKRALVGSKELRPPPPRLRAARSHAGGDALVDAVGV